MRYLNVYIIKYTNMTFVSINAINYTLYLIIGLMVIHELSNNEILKKKK